jgi:phosphate-selective porin OprO and OprP
MTDQNEKWRFSLSRLIHKSLLTSTLIVVATLVLSSTLHSEELETVNKLQEKLREQESRIEALERRLREIETPVKKAIAAPQESPALPPNPAPTTTVEWKGGPELKGPELKETGGRFTAKLRGRLQADYWTVSGDPVGRNYPSGSEIRSVRLGIEGRLGSAFSYITEVDFSGNSVTLNDAYLQYDGIPSWALQVGNIKPHISMENRTGLQQTTFLERSLPGVFAISDEILGFAAATSGKNWSFGIGGFGEDPSVSIDGNEGYGAASRFTFAPINDKGYLLHLGASGLVKNLTRDSGQAFRIRQRPESRIFATRLVDTGAHPTDNSAVIGVEFAAAAGPLSIQSEYLRNRIEYTNQPRATFDGAYIYASWFITGERRPYGVASGRFGLARPNRSVGEGGSGAVELALRYSTLDLSGGRIQGGNANDVTFGANWYLTDYTRLMFNWVHFDVDNSAQVRPFGTAFHDGDAFGVRAQVIW